MRQTHYPADFRCKDTHFLAFKGNVYSIFSLWILICISAVRTDERSKSRASSFAMPYKEEEDHVMVKFPHSDYAGGAVDVGGVV